MYAVHEMSEHVRFLASPSNGDSVKRRIERAAIKLGWDYETTWRVWYQKLKAIPTEMSDHIRAKAAAHDRELKANMVSATEAMLRADPAFYRPQIEAISELLLQAGNGAGQGRTED